MKKNNKQKQFSFHLDRYFLRNLVIVTAVVLIWRGIWNLIDAYLWPSNELMSNVVSILLGLFLLYLPDTDSDNNNNLDKLV